MGDPQIGLGILCELHPHFSSGIPVLVWGSPNQYGDPQTKMGCPHIYSKTMMATARRATMTMATARWAMAQQDMMMTTMATGNDENDDGDGATGNGATGDDEDDDCNEQRRRRRQQCRLYFLD